jgi:hypothetical protein
VRLSRFLDPAARTANHIAGLDVLVNVISGVATKAAGLP